MEYILLIIAIAVVVSLKKYFWGFIRQKLGFPIPTQNFPNQRPASTPLKTKMESEPGAIIIIFQNSKDVSIDAEENVKISKVTAIEHIKQQATEAEVSDNFLGFINPKGETIQLLRRSDNAWSLDSPITEGGSYSYSLKKDGLTTDQAIQITAAFFDGGDWQNILTLDHSK